MRKSTNAKFPSHRVDGSLAADPISHCLQSPTIAKRAVELYELYISALAGYGSPLQRLGREPDYSFFVFESHKQISQENPNFRQKDRAGKARRRVHRIGPHLYETDALKNRKDALPLGAKTRLQRTVDGVIEDFVRLHKQLRSRAVWKRLRGHLAERGVRAVVKKCPANIRRDSIKWEVNGEKGSKTFGRFEDNFTRARRPETTISG